MPLSYSKAADIKKFHREIGWNYKPKQEAFFKVKKCNTHGQWDEHFDKDGIIDVCVKDNKKKYTKAFDTSLMQPEWQVKLGCAGETSFAQRVGPLHGTAATITNRGHFGVCCCSCHSRTTGIND